MDLENPSMRSGEQVWCVFGAGTNSASVADDLISDPIAWTVSSNLSAFLHFWFWMISLLDFTRDFKDKIRIRQCRLFLEHSSKCFQLEPRVLTEQEAVWLTSREMKDEKNERKQTITVYLCNLNKEKQMRSVWGIRYFKLSFGFY